MRKTSVCGIWPLHAEARAAQAAKDVCHTSWKKEQTRSHVFSESKAALKLWVYQLPNRNVLDTYDTKTGRGDAEPPQEPLHRPNSTPVPPQPPFRSSKPVPRLPSSWPRGSPPVVVAPLGSPHSHRRPHLAGCWAW